MKKKYLPGRTFQKSRKYESIHLFALGKLNSLFTTILLSLLSLLLVRDCRSVVYCLILHVFDVENNPVAL